MKKYKYLLLTFLIPLLIPITAYAECTEEDLQDFKEKEKEFKITYEFDKETKKYILQIKNPDNQKYIYNSNLFQMSEENFEISAENGVTLRNVEAGKYEFTITSTNDNCTDTFKTISIDLPQYNNYSEDPLCAGLEDFYLCQPTYDKVVDYDTFVARVKLYKEKQETKKQNEQPKEEISKESKVVKYIKDNLLQIIVITIFVVMIVITIVLTVKSAKQSRRLE